MIASWSWTGASGCRRVRGVDRAPELDARGRPRRVRRDNRVLPAGLGARHAPSSLVGHLAGRAPVETVVTGSIDHRILALHDLEPVTRGHRQLLRGQSAAGQVIFTAASHAVPSPNVCTRSSWAPIWPWPPSTRCVWVTPPAVTSTRAPMAERLVPAPPSRSSWTGEVAARAGSRKRSGIQDKRKHVEAGNQHQQQEQLCVWPAVTDVEVAVPDQNPAKRRALHCVAVAGGRCPGRWAPARTAVGLLVEEPGRVPGYPSEPMSMSCRRRCRSRAPRWSCRRRSSRVWGGRDEPGHVVARAASNTTAAVLLVVEDLAGIAGPEPTSQWTMVLVRMSIQPSLSRSAHTEVPRCRPAGTARRSESWSQRNASSSLARR